MEVGQYVEGTIAEEFSPGERVAQRFELLLDRFRRADGEPWRHVEVSRATGGRVSSSYISALRRGELKQPGAEKLGLISGVMGFPEELWDHDPEFWNEVPGGLPLEPVDGLLELDSYERALLQLLRSLDNRRKEAVLVLARQVAVL